MSVEPPQEERQSKYHLPEKTGLDTEGPCEWMRPEEEEEGLCCKSKLTASSEHLQLKRPF